MSTLLLFRTLYYQIIPMMRIVYRIINLFRPRKMRKPTPVVTVRKEEYERWLGI
jgi:hypothetical protein